MRYSVRFVHKIAPKYSDTGYPVEISDAPQVSPRLDAKARNALARILRNSLNLLQGQRLNEVRVYSDGRIVCFPSASIWHSIILIPEK